MFLTINDIKEISVKMTEKIGVDYTGYSLTFFRRRLAYMFEHLGIHKVSDLYAFLENKEKADEIAYVMSIPSTELFRDPAFWRTLRKHLSDKSSLSVWFPNLTNSYELYSLVILLKQIGISDYSIVANVVSQRIESEIKDVHVQSKCDEVNRSNFDRLESGTQYEDYFEITEEGEVKPLENLLSNVKIINGWFMNNSEAKYDLILFRNMLLEYGNHLHENAVLRFADSLNEGGMLAIGIKESLLARGVELKPVEIDESLYRRV